MPNNKTKKTTRHFAVATGLCLVLTPLPSIAQEPEPIEEIIITATLRAAPLKEHAGNAASIVDVDFIAADHPSDILNRLPGVNIQHANGQEHLTSIRSPVLTAGAGAGSFLYLEDGIPLRSPGFANVNGLFEAHTEQAGRIEVIRGPGSALYGSNAVHGLINVLTIDPDELAGHSLDLSYGSHDQIVGKLAAHFPGDEHNGVLALTLKHDGGYRDISGYDQQKATLRTDWKTNRDSFTFVAAFNNLNQETAGYIKGLESYKDEALAKSNPNPEAFRDAKAFRAYLRWDRQLSDNMSFTITPYARKTDMDFMMHFLPGRPLEKNGHKSFGVQSRLYKERGDNGLIIAGLDLEYTDGFLSEVQDAPDLPFGGFVTGTHYDYTVKALLASPYVHTEWSVGENTRITAGLRVDFTSFDYNNKADTLMDPDQRYQRVADRTDDFVTATPKLGITHQLTNEITLFGLYARGQRAPQTTDLYRLQGKQVAGEIDPEIMDSVEIGLRGIQGPVRFELTGYVMRKENYFFRDSDGLNVTDGKTDHAGIELSFMADLHETLDLGGALTYAQHTYAFDNLTIQDGNDIDTAPEVLANVRLGWTPIEALRTELEWIHMDEYFTDEANDHSYEGHDLLNLRASYQVNQVVSVYGRVMNLTDTAYADRADFGFGDNRYFPGEERFFAMGVRVSL